MAQSPDSPNPDSPNPVSTSSADAGTDAVARATEELVERFGGIRPMASKLGIPVTTVQGWKKRGHVPESRRADILAAAATHAIPLTGEELDRATSTQPEEPETADTPPPPHPPEPPPPRREKPGPEVIDVEPEEIAPSPAPDIVGPDTPPDRPDRPATAVPDPDAPPAAPDRDAVERTRGRTAESGRDDLRGPYAPVPGPSPQRTSRIGAAAFVVAVVGLGVALFGLMRSGDLPGLGRMAQPSANPAAVQALQADLTRLIAQLDEARQEIAALRDRPAVAAEPAIPPVIEALPQRISELWEQIELLRESGAAGVDPTALDSLRQEIRALGERVQVIADRPVGDAAAPDLSPIVDAVNTLGRRVAALEGASTGGAEEGRIAAIERSVADLSAVVDQLAGRLATISSDAGRATEGEALVIAANQLQAALAAGRPYASELRGVRALSAGAPQLATLLDDLGGRADQGLPTGTALRARFDVLAPEIIRADRTRPDAGWVDQTLGRVSSLVTVRKAGGDVAGDSADAVVSRADAALDDGDLARAVEELSALSGPAAETAAPWLTDARAVVAAQRTAAAVTDLALGRLSGGTAP